MLIVATKEPPIKITRAKPRHKREERPLGKSVLSGFLWWETHNKLVSSPYHFFCQHCLVRPSQSTASDVFQVYLVESSNSVGKLTKLLR